MQLVEAAFNILANIILTLAGIFTGRALVIYIMRRREGTGF
jgi:CrcB protein